MRGSNQLINVYQCLIGKGILPLNWSLPSNTTLGPRRTTSHLRASTMTNKRPLPPNGVFFATNAKMRPQCTKDFPAGGGTCPTLPSQTLFLVRWGEPNGVIPSRATGGCLPRPRGWDFWGWKVLRRSFDTRRTLLLGADSQEVSERRKWLHRHTLDENILQCVCCIYTEQLIVSPKSWVHVNKFKNDPMPSESFGFKLVQKPWEKCWKWQRHQTCRVRNVIGNQCACTDRASKMQSACIPPLLYKASKNISKKFHTMQHHKNNRTQRQHPLGRFGKHKT